MASKPPSSARKTTARKTATTTKKARAPEFPFLAIREGKTAAVRAYIAAGGDINARVTDTLLIEAISVGNQSMFDWLLAQGADPEAVDYGKHSPLQIAAETGALYFVDELLKRSVDVHHRDSGGFTCLHYAARCDRVRRGPGSLPAPDKAKVIRLLLDAGADPLAVENAGRSPLDFIVGSDNQEGRDLLDLPGAHTRFTAAAGVPAPGSETDEDASDGQAVKALLSETVSALKAARGNAAKVEAVIGTYLAAGDALAMSPMELRDYFDISTPGLMGEAGFTAKQQEQGSAIFDKVSEARYER